MALPASLPLIVSQLTDPDLAMLDCAFAHADDLRALSAIAGFDGAQEERAVKRGMLVRVNELVLLLKCVRFFFASRCCIATCCVPTFFDLPCGRGAAPFTHPRPSRPLIAEPWTPRARRKRAGCT